MPGGRFEIIKKPSSLVVAIRSMPVYSDLAWTIAPGILAPFGSNTLPVIWPDSICPKATPDRKATTNRAVLSALLCPLKNCTRHDILNNPPLSILALYGLPTGYKNKTTKSRRSRIDDRWSKIENWLAPDDAILDLGPSIFVPLTSLRLFVV